jgi:molybdopterin/thiamine biosynthesis adenylyltransferase
MSFSPISFSEAEVERYARHLVLREIGGPGQQKLKAARVLVVGAGGLGAPAALYLAAAGVGTLGLVDADTVSLSNLQRQVLFSTADTGRPKVEAAAEHLTALNPHLTVETHPVWLGEANARARYRGMTWCWTAPTTSPPASPSATPAWPQGKTLVSGALGRWTGQVGVFQGQPCYRCLVPEIPPDAETCALVGVVGALAGVIGSMMALEAVKVITGAGQSLAGRLLIYDALAAETRTVRIGADPACPSCGV